MASNIISHGADLDAIFKPRGSEPPRPNVNYISGGVDIALRYFPSSYPTIDDRPAANTDLISGGTDLRNMFRSLTFAGGGGPGPVITSHPVSLARIVGGTATFSVTATGTGTLTYQWLKAGVPISGATSSSYTIFPVFESDESPSYQCAVTDSVGTTTSNAAGLLVGTAPTITSQPVGGTIYVGNVLNVVVGATGDPAPTYQWRKNGSNIAGATGSSYSFTTTSTGDGGNYDCLVSNPLGLAISNIAAVTVLAAGGTAPTITSHPAGGSIVVGNVLNVVVGATGDPPLAYQWRKNSTNIGGANSSSYSFVTSTPFDSGSYDCVVSNPYGSATSSAAYVTVSDVPPNITGGTVTGGPYEFEVGNFAHFTVTATGTSLNYAWYKNGSPTGHTGPSGPSFICSGPGDNGTYSVTVSNMAGSDSASTSLTVT